MPHEHAATGPERQTLTAIELLSVRCRTIDASVDGGQHAAHCHSADLLRRTQIALHQRRRYPQDARHVVEAVARIVGRQQTCDIDLKIEQIANGVAVLRPIQAMKRFGASRIWMLGRSTIELALQPFAEPVVRGFVRTRPPDWGHQPGSELSDDLLPHFRVLADSRSVSAIEHQAPQLDALVVAANAVRRHERRWILRGVRGLSHAAHTDRSHYHDCRRKDALLHMGLVCYC